MRLALAQINSVVGDLDGNASRVVEWLEQARETNPDVVLFPELVVRGSPPGGPLPPPRDPPPPPRLPPARPPRRRRDREGNPRHHRARRRAPSRCGPLQRVLRP